MIAQLALVLALAQPGPPAPPAAVGLPTGPLPWPVPDFGYSQVDLTSAVQPGHTTGYADALDQAQTNVDAMIGPIGDLSDTVQFSELPDASTGLDELMVTDPMTDEQVSVQSMVTTAGSQVAMPFSYGKAVLQFGGYIGGEFPHLSYVWLFLLSLMINVFLHMLVLFVRFVWAALGAVLKFFDMVAMVLAAFIPG